MKSETPLATLQHFWAAAAAATTLWFQRLQDLPMCQLHWHSFIGTAWYTEHHEPISAILLPAFTLPGCHSDNDSFHLTRDLYSVATKTDQLFNYCTALWIGRHQSWATTEGMNSDFPGRTLLGSFIAATVHGCSNRSTDRSSCDPVNFGCHSLQPNSPEFSQSLVVSNHPKRSFSWSPLLAQTAISTWNWNLLWKWVTSKHKFKRTELYGLFLREFA